MAGTMELSTPRRRTFRALSWLGAVAALAGTWGVASLVFGWFDNEDGGIHRVHDIGWGALAGAIVTTGFVMQLWRAERHVRALQMAALGGIGFVIGGLMSSSGIAIFGGAIVAVVVLVAAAHPARERMLAIDTKIDPALGLLAVAALVPAVRFALTMASLQRNGSPLDPHVKNDHWSGMASMAIGITLVALLAALTRDRVCARATAIAALVYGLASVVYPTRPGAEGTGWGIAIIAWGALFIAAGEMIRSEEPSAELPAARRLRRSA